MMNDFEMIKARYESQKKIILNLQAENARLKEELDNEQEHANDLWDELLEAKGELEKYDWKQGHPEHENEVLICTDNYGKKFYTTNSWKKGEYWNNLFQGKYIAYAEIRPFGKEQE